ncbi:MAG: IS66 family insertion sequence element accessory protein TnpB [Paracoccaceae bacterium]
MIHPSHGVQVFVATKPVDFRKGHDGLAALVQSHLQKKPFDGAVYVFRAKRADRLKMIWWDGTVWSWRTWSCHGLVPVSLEQ